MVSLSSELASAILVPALLAGSSLAAPAARQQDMPHIFRVEVSTRVVRAGQTVFGHVATSADVASVEARVQGFSALLVKRGAGDFALNYTLPPTIPWFLHGTYTVSVIARNTQGVGVTRQLPVTLQ